MAVPPLPLPTPGQNDWAGPLNESLEILNQGIGDVNDAATTAENTQAAALTAASDAQDAADAAEAVGSTNDAIMAGVADDSGSLTRGVLDELYGTEITFKSFGAVGDGTTDDTAALQAAIDSAGSGGPSVVIAEPGETYSVGRLILRSNVHIDLRGATIKARSAGVNSPLTAPSNAGEVGRLMDASVRNGTVDLAYTSHTGSRIQDAERVRYENLRFKNLRPQSSTGIFLGNLTEDCSIIECRFDMDLDEPYGTVTSSVGISCSSATVDSQSGGQNSTLTFEDPTDLSQGHTIRGNVIIGGTHGIALAGAERVNIEGNYIEGQGHRGIILSPRARFNTISGNRLKDFNSTGIHLAWGSDENVIVGNHLETTKSGNERDGIKAYFGCDRVVVVGNFVRGVLNGGIRFAAGCNDFNVVGNTVVGPPVAGTSTCILVESNLGSPYYQPSVGVTAGNVASNFLRSGNAGVRIRQTNTGPTIQRVSVSANRMHNNQVNLAITETDPSGVNLLSFIGNQLAGSNPTNTLPRGMAHFDQAIGNGPGVATKFANPISGTPAPATDASTTMILANDLRAKLISLGVIS